MAEPISCAKCLCELLPGSGDFFQVRIDAVADPFPPQFDDNGSSEEIRKNIEKLLAQMADVSERDAVDQVHRQLMIHLCNRCFATWIENPAAA